MGIETPLALLALAAGALPYLAHRIRRRELPIVALPTIQFLKIASAKKSRSQALADKLLLIIRTLILLLVAFALSAPYASDEIVLGESTRGHLAIVIDDSMSMAADTHGPSPLSLAKLRAAEAIESVADGSTVAVYLAGHPARLHLDPTSNTTEAIKSVRLIQESHRGNALSSAVKLAERQLKRTQRSHALHSTSKLLVLSDFAGPAHVSIPETDANITRILEPVGQETAPGNVYFVTASALPTGSSSERQPEIAVHASVEVQAPAPPAIELQVSLGDYEKTVSVPRTAGTHEIKMRVPSARDRHSLVKLRLNTKDRLSADNSRELVLGASSGTRLLVVNGDPQPGTRNDELFYLRRALNLLPPTRSQVTVTSADAASLVHHDLAGRDVLLLANVPAPSVKLAQRIVDFVESGGGLIITGGDHVDPSKFNARLGEVLPGHLQSASTPASTLHFAQSTNQNTSANLMGLNNAQVQKRLLLDTSTPPLVTYSDGSAAIARRNIGRGHTVLLTTTIDDDWTDLPLRPGFIASLAFVLNRAQGISKKFETEYSPGAAVTLPVPPGARQLEIIDPSGTEKRWDVSGRTTLAFKDTLHAGVYQTRISGQRGGIRQMPSLYFHVSPPLAESDLRPSAPDSRASDNDGSRRQTGHTKHDRRPLLWLLAGLLAIVESALRLGGHGTSLFERARHAVRRSSP